MVNTLAAGASEVCFEGEFTSDSTHNLATDGSAPSPPEDVTGAVSVRGAISGVEADLHLACDVRDQAVTISSNSQVSVENLFDGDARTTIYPNEANPLWVRLEFASPRTVTGTSVLASNCASHLWSLEVADTVDDLEARTGSWREVVPSRLLENWERAFATVMFDEPVTASVFQLNAVRTCDSYGVLLNEWQLHGLNPACGTGIEPALSPTQPVLIDVDGAGRVGVPDIGADQTRTVEIRVERHPQVWYEEEGVARIPVILTDPAQTPVTVRMATYDDNAIAGEDYQPVMGLLRWEPGEIEKVVEVPLIVDGVTDPDEGFWFFLNDAAGAVLQNQWHFFVIGEGAPPVRVQLAAPVFEAWESDGVLRGEVEIDEATDVDVLVVVEVFSRTAKISQDFTSPGNTVVIPAGETRGTLEIDLIQDTETEPTEELILQLSWATNAEHGARAYAIGRIHDSPLVIPEISLGGESFVVGEGDGVLRLPVHLSEATQGTVEARFEVTGGSAEIGRDVRFPAGLNVAFSPGEVESWLEIEITDDLLFEGDETLVLALTAVGTVLGAPSVASVTILDNEPEIELDPSYSSYWIQECGRAEIELAEGFVVTEGTFTAWAEVTTGGVTQVFEASDPVTWDSYSWIWIESLSTTSTVTVLVAPAIGEPAVGVGVEIEVVAPEIDLWDLEPVNVDGEFTITLNDTTVYQRFTDSTVLLRNLTTGVDVVPDDPCEVGVVTVSIPVSGPDDLVVLEACNGDPALGLCTTHQLNPEVP